MAIPSLCFFLQDLDTGGIQRHTLALARAMKPYFNVSVIAHAADKAEGFVPADMIENCQSLNERGLWDIRKWIKITKAVAAKNPDLVVSANQIPSILILFARLTGIIKCPVVVIFHSTTVTGFSGWIRTLPFFPAVWSANAMVYVSANQRRLWTKRLLIARRTETIINGIDLSPFTPPSASERAEAKQRLGLSESDYVIGCLAAFRYEKNHRQIIEAVAQLKQQGTTAKALLVGDGPTRETCEALAKDLGISDQCRFEGKRSDVLPYLRAMDVSVLTSLSIETLSLAALEAMSMGTPMVMSDIGGASEIIDDGKNGYLFAAGDTAALVNRLIKLSDPVHRAALAIQARQTVEDKFTAARMYESYTSLFQQITKKTLSPVNK